MSNTESEPRRDSRWTPDDDGQCGLIVVTEVPSGGDVDDGGLGWGEAGSTREVSAPSPQFCERETVVRNKVT